MLDPAPLLRKQEPNGVRGAPPQAERRWIPAFAGMTGSQAGWRKR